MATKQQADEQALVTKQQGNGALTKYEPPAELDGFDKSDVVLPICSLMQPMSQKGGKEGTFYFPDGRELESMRVVVLHMLPTRAVWAPMSEGIGEPLCRSADRKLGWTRYPLRIMEGKAQKEPEAEPTAIQCADCRLGLTNTTFKKTDDGLWCPNGYSLLLADYETAQPFMYFVKGAAMKEVKQKIVSPIIRASQQSGKYEPWLNAYLWTSRLVQETGKKYHTPVIVQDTVLEDVHADYYAGMSAEYRPRAEAQTIEDTPPVTEEQERFA